ncbi:MAG: hypothetical protein LBS73_02915 [Campylobacteraceae bacterium]|jgi:hypothetical protein|nr:hypothetical protein [Campylobacteraceae bacterium]
MVVAIVLGVLVFMGALAFLSFTLHTYALQNFNFKFFSIARMLWSFAGVATVGLGVGVLLGNGTIEPNGVLLIGAGALILLCLLYSNIKNTNLAYGIAGTLLGIIVNVIVCAVLILIFSAKESNKSKRQKKF